MSTLGPEAGTMHRLGSLIRCLEDAGFLVSTVGILGLKRLYRDNGKSEKWGAGCGA